MISEILIGKIDFDLSKAFSTESVTIFIVGYVVVFAALVLLYLIFFSLSKILSIQRRRELFRKGKIKSTEENVEDISGEVNAAISLAIHMFLNEAHDEESYVSTIKRVSRIYSPWSSKIYNVRNAFNRS